MLALLQRDDVAIDDALLSYATTSTEASAPVDSPSPTPLSSGCWGEKSDQHKIQIVGLDVAWQKLTVGGFCWRNGRLTSWGGDSGKRWSGFAYCWTNTSGPDDWWYHNPTWRRASLNGELGGNSGFGCVGLQHDDDWLGYGLNNGSPAWILH